MFRKLGAGLAACLLLSCAGQAIGQPLSGTNVYEFNGSSHIITAGTTANLRPTSGAGLLVNVCVNTAGPAASTVTLYDSASGVSATVLAVIDTTVVGCKVYNYSVKAGIVAVVVSVATFPDLSVGWR